MDSIDNKFQYNDVSGFCFDLPPINMMNSGSDRGTASSQFYGASYGNYTPKGEKGYSPWLNWIEKIQPDKRFLAVSDKNAYTYQFPEVESPWKFTTYTFKGVSQYYQTTIIEPDLFSPKTLEYLNSRSPKMTGFQYKDYYEPLYMYTNVDSGKEFKQEDLEKGVDGYEPWYDNTASDEHKRDFSRGKQYGNRKLFDYSVPASDIELNAAEREVQSIEIGAHTNIPAHTLNMMAPLEFMSPDNVYKNKVVVKMVATRGYPLYAETTGCIIYSAEVPAMGGLKRIYIEPLTNLQQDENDKTIFIPIVSNTQVKQPKPSVSMSTVSKLHMVATDFSTEDFIHPGCRFFRGNKGGCTCQLLSDNPDLPVSASCILKPDDYENIEEDKKCKLYSSDGTYPEIALYEFEAQTQSEIAEMYGDENFATGGGQYNSLHESKAATSMNGSTLGGGARDPRMSSLGAMAASQTPLDKPRTTGDTAVRWKMVYDIEKVGAQNREISKGYTWNNEKDTIVPGTGRFTIDSYDTSYGGVDTDFFEDRNLLSIHRFNANVKPCFKADKCNPFHGPSMSLGFQYGVFAGIDDKGKPDDKLPYCRYYTPACPYNGLTRRSMEYAYNYMWLVKTFAIPFFSAGTEAFPSLELEKAGDIWRMVGPLSLKESLYPYATVIEGIPYEDYGVYLYIDKLGEDGEVVDDTALYAHITQYDQKGMQMYLKIAYDKPEGYPENIPWLVQLDKDYKLPSDFIVQIDNEKPFYGGRAPEYKDYSKMGDEVLCPMGETDGNNIFGSDTSGSGRGGADDPRHMAETDSGFMYGYRIDKDGEWIVDGRELGGTVSADPSVRLPGKPKHANGATPIHFSVASSIISPQMTMSSRPISAVVYSSDTRDFLLSEDMQSLENEEGKPCPPHIPPEGRLPVERQWYTCSSCSFHEDVVITDLEYNNGITTCPICDGELTGPEPWTKFPGVKSVGKVTIWGLPGQELSTDAVYWNNPTVINRSIVSQILNKLGPSNSSGGGGYPTKKGESADKSTETALKQYLKIQTNTLTQGLETEDNENPTQQELDYYSHRDVDDKEEGEKLNNALADMGIDNLNRLDGGTYNDKTVSPYDTKTTGVDMLTINHLKMLRNHIAGVMSYTLGDAYSEDFSMRKQMSAKDRHHETSRQIPNTPGTLPHQILAATEDGGQQFIQVWDGTFVPCHNIRVYYPTGPVWWRLNGVVGAIQRSGGTNLNHFDDSSATEGPPSWRYTGDRIISSAYFFLHGEVPLDKEIAKAYLLLYPAGEPSKAPIGETWNGIHQKRHYHAYLTDHEWNTNHESFTMYSDDIDFTSVHADHYASAIYNIENVFYKDDSDIIKTRLENNYGLLYIYPWEHILQWNGFGTDIIQHATEDELWKNTDFDRFKQLVDQDKTDIVVTVGKPSDNTRHEFTMYSERLLKTVFNQKCQPIHDMFDFGGMNSTGFYSVNGPVVADKTTNTNWADDGQVIMQSDGGATGSWGGSGATGSWDDGGHGDANGGLRPRVIDITEVVKNRYNERLDRAYKASTCNSYDELYDININRHSDSYNTTYPPDASNNDRYVKSQIGLLLSDDTHHVDDEGLDMLGSGDQLPITPSGRIESYSTYYDTGDNTDKYHPFVLCHTVDGEPDTDGKYWYTVNDIRQQEFFVMDLLNVPVMTAHKPYRFESGHWDVSNAVCPNKSCVIGSMGLTVTEAIARQQARGIGTASSVYSTKCAYCGSSLIDGDTGAVYIGGDGIDTYSYLQGMTKECFVNGIKIAQDIDGTFIKQMATSFSVDYQSDDMTWHNLFSVKWNETESLWEYNEYDKNGKYTLKKEDSLPDIFKGVWADGNIAETVDNEKLKGCHFLVPRTRYIRYRAEPRIATRYDNIAGNEVPENAIDGQTFTTTSSLRDSMWDNGKLEFADDFIDGEVFVDFPIISNTETKVSLKTEPYTAGAQRYRIRKEFFTCICSKFEVYGYERYDGDVVMTEDSIQEKYVFTPGMNTILLNNTPTKILSVLAGINDIATIPLTEMEKFDDDKFVWKLERVVDNTTNVEYYNIISGVYYYMPEERKIMFPSVCVYEEDKILLWTLNAEVGNFSLIGGSKIPNFIQINYLKGMGASVELPIEAIGTGPSYQVEKEAVCYISSYEFDNTKTPDLIPQSTAELPPMGYSAKYATDAKEVKKEKLTWMVYNHKPLYGDFYLNYLVGNELPKAGWTEGDIERLFGGADQTKAGLEDGPSSYICGKVHGNVTLYGMSNTIISGDLFVYARAITTRHYVVGDERVTTYERTGGLKATGFAVTPEIKASTATSSRKGKCFKPVVKIFMQERDNTQPIT